MSDMLTFEQFNTKQQNGDPALSGRNLKVFADQLQLVAMSCAGNDELKETPAEFMGYADAFTMLSMGFAGGPLKRMSYEKLAGFGEFINGVGEDGVPNINRLADISKRSGRNIDLFAMLGSINDALEMGLDVEALRERASRQPSAEKQEEQEEAAPDREIGKARAAGENATLSAGKDLSGSKTAAAHIEALRDKGFPEKDPSKLSDEQLDVYTDRFLKIMAARELADSVRGSKARLVSTTLSAEDINARALSMKKDATFSRFADRLKSDPRMMKAAIAAAGKGHGGGLDDMFRDFVKNQSACELRNDAILKRYMPTVKERIEILQERYRGIVGMSKELEETDAEIDKQRYRARNEKRYDSLVEKKEKLGNALEDADPVEKIAAEIIQLRNLGHAVKGKKASLDKPVPVAAAYEKESLSAKAGYLADEDMGILEDPKVTELIMSGHGGDMAEKARELAKADMDPEKNREELAIYNGNTVGQRLSDLKQKAGELSGALDEQIEQGGPTEDLMKQSMDLLAETMLLDGRVRDPKTGGLLDAEMGREVPWSSVDKMLSGNPENNPTFKQLFGSLDPEEMTDVLNELNEKGHDGFVKGMAEQKVEEEEEAELENDPLNTAVDYGKKVKHDQEKEVVPTA